MIIYFADRMLNILGNASTSLPNGIKITEDTKTEDIKTSSAVFECSIVFNDDNRLKIESMVEAGNYLLRSNDDENEIYTIIETELDTKNKTVYLYCEDVGLDLINEVVGEFKPSDYHTVEWYVNKYVSDAGFEVEENDMPNVTKKLVFDTEQTITERLQNISEAFNCELEFSFEIDKFEIVNKIVNIHEKIGRDTEIQLRLNKDIDSIVVKKTVANLATALKCTGGTPKGKDKPITLSGYTVPVEYSDEFYIDGAILKSKTAIEKWSRYLAEGNDGDDSHIVKHFSYDTTSQQTLFLNAIAELRKIDDVEVNYEVSISNLPRDIMLGDRVYIVDETGELFLESRVLSLETSICSQSATATLGEFLIKKSGISETVRALASDFAATKSVILDLPNNYATTEDVENVKGIADDAKSTAENAQTESNNASSKADSAVEKAETADIKADNAKDVADVAKESAATAQTSADNANTLASQLDEKVTNLQASKADITALNATNAEIENLKAKDIEVGSILANKADITDLDASNAKITVLETDTANISNLITTKATITDLNAANAEIDTLKTSKADVSDLNATNATINSLSTKYAAIDFANVEKQSVGILLADVGLITSANIVDSHVTGYLDSVEINANNITAGTLTVDRLVISGSDKSLVYALNNMGDLVSSEVNTIDGDVITKRTITADHIVAGSITSNEIDVADLKASIITADSITATEIDILSLQAALAKIGPFNIFSEGLYTDGYWDSQLSTVSGSVDGVYIGKDKISFGKNEATCIKKDGSFYLGRARADGLLHTIAYEVDESGADTLSIFSTSGITMSDTSIKNLEVRQNLEVSSKTSTNQLDVNNILTVKSDAKMFIYGSASFFKGITSDTISVDYLGVSDTSLFRKGFVSLGTISADGGMTLTGHLKLQNNSDITSQTSINMYGESLTFNDVEVLTEDSASSIFSKVGHSHPRLENHVDGDNTVAYVYDTNYMYLRPNASNPHPTVLGSSNNPFYNTWTERLNVTASRITCLPSYTNTTTNNANVYVGNTGLFTRHQASSSRTIKHDIKALQDEEIKAENLYDVKVVQFKYNDGIITDTSDCRYGKTLPGIIIEDLEEKYPIAVDKPSDDVKDWSWNGQYLIPGMLKLIQEQKKEIDELRGEINILKEKTYER